MNSKVIEFDTSFDGTDMSPMEIREEARERGWPGIRINAEEWHETDILIVRRMPVSAASGATL